MNPNVKDFRYFENVISEYNLSNGEMGEITDSFLFVRKENYFCKVGGGSNFKSLGIVTFEDVWKHAESGPVYAIHAEDDGYVIHDLTCRPISFKPLGRFTFCVIHMGFSAPIFDHICSMPGKSINNIFFNKTSGTIVRARYNKQIQLLPKNEFLISIPYNGRQTDPGCAIFCQKTRQFIGIYCGREGVYGHGVDLRFKTFLNSLFTV